MSERGSFLRQQPLERPRGINAPVRLLGGEYHPAQPKVTWHNPEFTFEHKPRRGTASNENGSVELTKKESEVLRALFIGPTKVKDTEAISSEVWPQRSEVGSMEYSKEIRVIVNHLRNKLKTIDAGGIETNRGLGYSIKDSRLEEERKARSNRLYSNPNFEFDAEENIVSFSDRPDDVSLTPTEGRVLEKVLSQDGELVSYGDIASFVYNTNVVDKYLRNTILIIVARLRTKLGFRKTDPNNSLLVIEGKGVMFKTPDPQKTEES